MLIYNPHIINVPSEYLASNQFYLILSEKFAVWKWPVKRFRPHE